MAFLNISMFFHFNSLKNPFPLCGAGARTSLGLCFPICKKMGPLPVLQVVIRIDR